MATAASGPLPTREVTLTANRLLGILERSLHASMSEWLFLRGLRLGTGCRNSSAQRLDAFALNCLPHQAMRRLCYEVFCEVTATRYDPCAWHRQLFATACSPVGQDRRV